LGDQIAKEPVGAMDKRPEAKRPKASADPDEGGQKVKRNQAV
jgi:hypothetical protein